MAYLTGNCVKPYTAAEAKALIGKRVQFLRRWDIDKSGRGYFFPKYGTVTGAHRTNIEIDGDMVAMSDIVEMVLCPAQETENA